ALPRIHYGAATPPGQRPVAPREFLGRHLDRRQLLPLRRLPLDFEAQAPLDAIIAHDLLHDPRVEVANRQPELLVAVLDAPANPARLHGVDGGGRRGPGPGLVPGPRLVLGPALAAQGCLRPVRAGRVPGGALETDRPRARVGRRGVVPDG